MEKRYRLSMKLSDRIYLASPGFIQDLISFMLIRLWVPWYNFGLDYILLKFIVFYNNTMFRIDYEKHQMRRLRKLLKHCHENVPYYRELFDREGIDWKNIKKFKDLERIPVLTKELLVKNFDGLKSRRMYHGRPIIQRTSGTTGTPTRFLLDIQVDAIRHIVHQRLVKDIGLRLTDRHISVFSNYFLENKNLKKKKIVRHPIYRKVLFSALANNEKDIRLFLDLMKKFKPKYINCMPSLMYLAAQYAEKKDIDIGFDVMISDRESLFPFQEKKIQEVFGCRIFNQYGQMECVFRALKSPGKDYFDCDHYMGIFEIVDDKGKQIRDAGRIIATGLVNYSMPLIRFETSDLGSRKILDGLPALTNLQARESDIIKLGERYTNANTLSKMLDEIDEIKECQFLHSKDKLILKIVKRKKYIPKHHDQIISTLRSFFGKHPDLRIEYVKSIPRTKSGKFEFIKKI